MEIAVRIGDGQFYGDLIADECQHFRRAGNLHVLGELHLLGAGLATGSHHDHRGEQEENFKDILHFRVQFYCG